MGFLPQQIDSGYLTYTLDCRKESKIFKDD